MSKDSEQYMLGHVVEGNSIFSVEMFPYQVCLL